MFKGTSWMILSGFAAMVMCAGLARADVMYLLDFQYSSANVAPGFQVANESLGWNASFANATFTLGAATLTVHNMITYGFPSTSARLTVDYFYTKNSTPRSFEITGLTADDRVTLYAIKGYYSSAAFVSFGGGSAVDLAGSTAPSDSGGTGHIGDMVLVASNVAPNLTGTIAGTIALSDGTTTRTEAEVGGFAIIISHVPEPASAALMAMGGVMVLCRRKRA